MKIAILALGTRGDVQPSIALGKALKARGHDVVLGAPDNFASWAEGHGLAFRSLGIDMQAFLQTPEVRQAIGGRWLVLARICPLAFDQPFWARRVHALGCGPAPQPLKRLSADRFAAGLRDLTGTPSYRQRAGAIATAIAREDGLTRAVAVVEAARR